MTDDKKERVKATWNDMLQYVEERKNHTKTETFTLPDGRIVEFTLRGLTTSEIERFETLMAEDLKHEIAGKNRIDFANEDGLTIRAKHFYLSHGIVSAPEGFNPKNKEHIRALPSVMKTELSNTIDDLTNMEIEVQRKFR